MRLYRPATATTESSADHEAALRNRNTSFVIDGEAVLLEADGRQSTGLHARKHDDEVSSTPSTCWSATARICANCL